MNNKLKTLAVLAAAISLQAQAQDKVYMVSNAHFDTQWNWDIQRSIREFIPKTMESNILLLERYPNYIFNFEGGVKYNWMKEYFPFEYETVKKFIKAGRWHISGATWDATDTNIGSAESLTRNILYGQQFYQQEFGVKSTDIFLPDCFGFTYALPSVAAHSGIIGFSTQKLQWRNNPFYGKSKIPFEWGLWEGIDGTRIGLVADAHNYTTKWPDEDLTNHAGLKKMTEAQPLHTIYHYYGTGDTGGSPTMESVRAVDKSVNGKGSIQIISATSDQLFKDYMPYDKHPELPVFKGELLMDVHGTGCYTSQAAMKLYNRRNELQGAAAEHAAAMADILGVKAYPKQEIAEHYKRFIFHQFHDDLTGTSIPRAYEFSWNDELISLAGFTQELTSASGAVSQLLDTQVKGTPVILYNASGFEANEVVEVEVPATKAISVYNEKGVQVPSQLLQSANGKAKLLISASVPAMSYTVYEIRNAAGKAKSQVSVTANTLENSIYKVTLDKNGDICSILDKREDKELVEKGKAIRLVLFTKNPSYSWPAWEILKTTLEQETSGISENVRISIAEQGALRGALCVERTYGDSRFKQFIRLQEGGQADRIDVVNEVDWQTTDALLKAEFPLSVANTEASYDISLGHVKRGNNTLTAYEVYSHYWTDLTDKSGNYGVSVLNDSKYGWDKPADNLMRLTLLHTPSTKSGYKYQNQQDFGHHEFTYSIVGHAGSLQSAMIPEKAEELNQPVAAFVAPKHKGTMGRQYSLASVDNPNVMMKAFKMAENDDTYIVRFYETSGEKAQHASFKLTPELISAEEVNGIEERIGAATVSGNALDFTIQPFGIKSFKLKLAGKSKKAPESVALALPYNLKAASYNGFRRTVNFDGKGYSYAAELMPAAVNFKGITLPLADPDAMNAVKCRGQEIQLPAGNYNKIYLLAAATNQDQIGKFQVGTSNQNVNVPSYTGFYGQWGHTGHTEGYIKNAEIAWVGTHRHEMSKNQDLPYEFTYLFGLTLDIPAKAQTLVLPENANVVIFSAVAVNEQMNVLTPATNLMGINLPVVEADENAPALRNLVAGKPIIDKSGEINYSERAELALDDDISTKWCDITTAKEKFLTIDMGKEQEITGWRVFHAGMESLDYIAKEYSLYVKGEKDADWKQVDKVQDNTSLETDRLLSAPAKARYVKIVFTKPDQSEGGTVRLYEFSVY